MHHEEDDFVEKNVIFGKMPDKYLVKYIEDGLENNREYLINIKEIRRLVFYTSPDSECIEINALDGDVEYYSKAMCGYKYYCYLIGSSIEDMEIDDAYIIVKYNEATHSLIDEVSGIEFLIEDDKFGMFSNDGVITPVYADYLALIDAFKIVIDRPLFLPYNYSIYRVTKKSSEYAKNEEYKDFLLKLKLISRDYLMRQYEFMKKIDEEMANIENCEFDRETVKQKKLYF